MENDFHRLRRRKTDLALRIWFLRIHDHGLVRLHIYELVIDLFYGFQGKFLIFCGGGTRVFSAEAVPHYQPGARLGHAPGFMK
jgi:hypothetical protein